MSSPAEISNGGDLERRPIENGARRHRERGVVVTTSGEDLLDLVHDVSRRLARDGAALEHQGAPFGNRRRLAPAGDGGGVQETAADQRVSTGREFVVAALGGGDDRCHLRDGVDAEFGTRPVGSRPGDLDLDPDEAAVGGGDDEFGGFEDDGGVCTDGPQHLDRTETGFVLVRNGSHDDVAGESGPGTLAVEIRAAARPAFMS